VISGGVGKDSLTGGSGSDQFTSAAGDSKEGGASRDIVTDFQSCVDTLDLSALDIRDFDAQVSYKAIGSGLVVYVDTNHNGSDYSDFGVQLTVVKALHDAGFLI
ncbi:MAG: M10 family metallopeptidase C-terminal domain-containing protein, partial [Sphingobium sp.]